MSEAPTNEAGGHPVPESDLAGYVLGILAPGAAAAFEDHLARCEACRAEVSSLSGLPRLLALAPPAPAVPARLGERTLAAVAAEADCGRTRRVPSPPRRRIAALAVAAALVSGLLVTGALALVGGGAESGTGVREVALLPVGATGASGVAQLERSGVHTTVRVEVAGLPPNEDGSFYECWWRVAGTETGASELRSAGTFTVGADGRAAATMSVAARPAADVTPVISVTREPPDGDPASSGDVVLRSAGAPG